jgi:hypothetical protein
MLKSKINSDLLKNLGLVLFFTVIVVILQITTGCARHQNWTLKKYDAFSVQPKSDNNQYIPLGTWLITKGKQTISISKVEVAGVLDVCQTDKLPDFLVKISNENQSDLDAATARKKAEYNQRTQTASLVTTVATDITSSMFYLEIFVILPEQYPCSTPTPKDFVLSNIEIQEGIHKRVKANLWNQPY